MGRLTLNVLLSFAQFEREVTGERIRDKIAASKQKGMWMGGWVPIGYDRKDRTLTINESEALTVRTIFDLFLKLRNVRRVQTELVRLNLTTKRLAIAMRLPTRRSSTQSRSYSAIISKPTSMPTIRIARSSRGGRPLRCDATVTQMRSARCERRSPH